LIIVIFLFVIGGGVFLYFYKRQVQKARLQSALIDIRESRSRAAVEAELKERNRIGQELHDGLGQMLTIVKLNMGVLKKKTQQLDSKNEELFDSAIISVDQAFKELRNISRNLGPGILSEMSLDNALQVLANQIKQSTQINIQMETMGLESIKDHILEITIYRSVQELVNNAIKHAFANDIHVQVITDDIQVSILVEDNGKGFNSETLEKSSGLGLKNIRSRIENLGGNFFMDTRESRGCIFQIFIPLKKQKYYEEHADQYYGG
jgi:signal transduction histidine kinase